MPRVGLTGPTSGGDLRFGLGFPGVAPVQYEGGWIRVYSNWLYYLFVGDQLVGEGGGDGRAEAWDLTSFPESLSPAFEPSARAPNRPFPVALETQSVPLVVVDGQIGNRRFSSESGWQRMEETDPKWLSGAGSSKSRRACEARYASARGHLSVSCRAWLIVVQQIRRALACVHRWLVGVCIMRSGSRSGYGEGFRDSPSAAAVWMLSLPILGIIVAEALQLRLSGTDGILLFIRPENLWFVQILGPFFLAAAIAAYYTAPAHVSDADAVGGLFARGICRHLR